MRSWKWYSKLGLALAVTAFAWFVWPTPWQYSDTRHIRWHRVTGQMQQWGNRGWIDREAALREPVRVRRAAPTSTQPSPDDMP